MARCVVALLLLEGIAVDGAAASHKTKSPVAKQDDGLAVLDATDRDYVAKFWRTDGKAADAPLVEQMRLVPDKEGSLRGSATATKPRPSFWPDANDMPDIAPGLFTEAEIAQQRNTHVTFSTGCEKVHDWQSATAFYTHRKYSPYTNITRLISCYCEATAQEKGGGPAGSGQGEIRKPRADNLIIYTDPRVNGVGQQHLAPLYSPHPDTKDEYLAYMKSASITHWYTHSPPSEEIVISIDPDMLILKPIDLGDITPETLKGNPVSQNYGTLGQCYGVLKALLKNKKWTDAECRASCPTWIKGDPDNPIKCGCRASLQDGFDQGLGPEGPYFTAGSAGPPYVLHRDDFERMAPRWKYYTEAIRNYATDAAGWIADMCSHGFAVLDLGLKQRLRSDWMLTNGCEAGSSTCDGPKQADAATSSDSETAWVSPELGWNHEALTWEKNPYLFHYDAKAYSVRGGGGGVLGGGRVPGDWSATCDCYLRLRVAMCPFTLSCTLCA